MEFKKVAISLFLLLTYSIGFAHNLAPHCGDFSGDMEIHTHQHCDKSETISNHNHVDHNDHYDDGIFDYLACLIHETENHETECAIEHCFTISNNSTSVKKINKLYIAIVFTSFIQPIIHSKTIGYYSKNKQRNYSSPPLEDSYLRGPPFIS